MVIENWFCDSCQLPWSARSMHTKIYVDMVDAACPRCHGMMHKQLATPAKASFKIKYKDKKKGKHRH